MKIKEVLQVKPILLKLNSSKFVYKLKFVVVILQLQINLEVYTIKRIKKSYVQTEHHIGYEIDFK